MRVTNQMMTNNSLRNLSKATTNMNDLNNSMTTGKKIQRPSEDPVVAIRALKLRSSVNQLNQYKQKNIPDAQSWLSLTESSLSSIVKSVKDVYYYCVEGSSDSFSTENRSSIVDDLEALKESIYGEGSTNYAGRYIFTGYKTDTNLLFDSTEDVSQFQYDITQKLSGADISVKDVTLGEINKDSLISDLTDVLAGTKTASDLSYDLPTEESIYRIRLAYDETASGTTPSINLGKDSLGADIPLEIGGSAVTINTMAPTDSADYYKVDDDEINYIPETGELILGKNVYDQIKTANEINISYTKEKFEEGDLRPEHYFDCVQRKTNDAGVTTTKNYIQSEDGQNIEYEVNLNQKVKVNTEGKDALKHDLGRDIDEISGAVTSVLECEDKVATLEKMLSNPMYSGNTEAVKAIQDRLDDANTELALKRANMTKVFTNGVTSFQSYQDEASSLVSDSGGRTLRVEMIASRVSEQYTNFTDLKSTNEDAELEETVIKFNSAELVYNASLMATGEIIQKTLLDFI